MPPPCGAPLPFPCHYDSNFGLIDFSSCSHFQDRHSWVSSSPRTGLHDPRPAQGGSLLPMGHTCKPEMWKSEIECAHGTLLSSGCTAVEWYLGWRALFNDPVVCAYRWIQGHLHELSQAPGVRRLCGLRSPCHPHSQNATCLPSTSLIDHRLIISHLLCRSFLSARFVLSSVCTLNPLTVH